MKVTVFGGSGFLGSHVCDQLSNAGYQVTIFDQVESQWLREDQQMFIGDILNEEQIAQAIQNAQFVFNFAGIADLDEAQARPIDTVRNNILGNTMILEACRQASVERYVFASSVYVYSKTGGFYRCSKQACELYIENYHEYFGLEYTILRYGSLYGQRSDSRNTIHRFVHQALTEKKITYGGSPKALREYIHVEDAARSSVKILEPEYANEHIVLTGHQPMRVGDLLKMIGEMLNEELKFEFESNPDYAHYEITPYSFNPRVGKKLAATFHVDLGQGVLHIVEELHQKLNPELHSHHGFLVEE
ncbi:MAG: NAD(P)-dependent oxidoreductase [SAR324 cluster bacterium]|nr:NAD(P)-dependent oxidoreductase [SAR324 cluster bacterium]